MHTENRFSDADRDAYKNRINETVSGWGDHKPQHDDVLTLQRVGAHALGCSTDDLRDSEIDELRDYAAHKLGFSTARCTVRVVDDSALGFHHCDAPNAFLTTWIGAGHAICLEHQHDDELLISTFNGTTTITGRALG